MVAVRQAKRTAGPKVSKRSVRDLCARYKTVLSDPLPVVGKAISYKIYPVEGEKVRR